MNKRMVALVKMLSSSSDGEVLNAARLLGRLLEAHGVDWNDLGEYLSRWKGIAEQSEPEPQPARQWPGGPPKSSYHRRSTRTFAEVDISIAKDMVEALMNDTRILRRMRRKDQEFVESLQEKFEQFGDNSTISEAQYVWLKGLYDRHA